LLAPRCQRRQLRPTTNDTLANLGVILAGFLVAWTGSPIPDLLIGTGISLLVLEGGLRSLREARSIDSRPNTAGARPVPIKKGAP
jgi:Co/Zn/Cd efflux system component